jgi:tRNA (adenine22-N1)-methyltransferase
MALSTLGPRLGMVASFAAGADVLADIGSDHAHLALALLTGGWIRRAIAIEIAPGPLAATVRAVSAAVPTVARRVDVRRADGLSGLQPGEADAIAIAGMGGATIADLLVTPAARAALAIARPPRLIVQPMNRPQYVRHVAAAIQYDVYRDAVAVEATRMYTVLELRPRSCSRRFEPTRADVDWRAHYGELSLHQQLLLTYGPHGLRARCPHVRAQLEADLRRLVATAGAIPPSASTPAQRVHAQMAAIRDLLAACFGVSGSTDEQGAVER